MPSQILLTWRSKMAEVASSYLDPSGEYFSGFGYRYDSRYDMPSFWTGKGRARLRDVPARQGRHGGLCAGRDEPQVRRTLRCHYRSEVHVHQIHGRQLYLMTDSTLADGGIEQHSRRGDEVITVIARNTQRGQILEISTGELIKLVQDERLRFPSDAVTDASELRRLRPRSIESLR